MNIENDLGMIVRRQEEVMRFLAILVERAGGEVLILPQELQKKRTLRREEGPHGSFKLVVEKVLDAGSSQTLR